VVRSKALLLLSLAPTLAVLTVLAGPAAGALSVKGRVTLSLVVAAVWALCYLGLRDALARPMQSISNVLASLREGDYSVRAAVANADDDTGVALMEANALADELRAYRLDDRETAGFLASLVDELEAAIFVTDRRGRVSHASRGGQLLVGREAVGADLEQLGLAACLEGPSPRNVTVTTAGVTGRYELRRTPFRRQGREHQLVVLTDVQRAVREEERVALRRMVRVLGHEINNSLSPLQSVATTLQRKLDRGDFSPETVAEMRKGLDIIHSRSKAMARFMEGYAALAKVPPPRLEPVGFDELLERVAAGETRRRVAVESPRPLRLRGDAGQLVQLVTNLVGNAVEAMDEAGAPTDAAVGVRARVAGRQVVLDIVDRGIGLPDSDNLFAPFFTTKPSGTGIGLLLSRQIAEAHGGGLSLLPNDASPGTTARVVLPVDGAD